MDLFDALAFARTGRPLDVVRDSSGDYQVREPGERRPGDVPLAKARALGRCTCPPIHRRGPDHGASCPRAGSET
jgi:hypothetical protein